MDSELLKNNLQLFSNRFEHLHKALMSLPQKNKLPDGIEIIHAKNNEKSATFEKNYLHSAYNPSKESKNLMSNAEIVEAESIVFLGVGLGYGPIECALQHKNKTIIIIEPNPYYIILAFSYLDWSAVFRHNSLVFLVEAPQQTVIAILEQYGLKECFFVSQKAIMQHDYQYFKNIQTLVDRNLDKQAINMRTLERFSKLWLSNMCKNLPHIENLDGIQRFENKAENLSACIIAAGPTLDDILPYLGEIKNRCILICVDTALRACLKVGVEPHFILVVDPQYWNARHIDGLEAKTSILITESAAYPSIFRFPCKEIILCSSLFPLGKYIEKFTGKKGELSAGGSVATTAWDFARFIGCKQIFMAGLDLSFPEKKTHTKGSTFEEKSHYESTKVQTTETALAKILHNPQTEVSFDYDGNKVITDARMKLYAWWFESKCASNPHLQTYSLSKKSLKIPLIEPMDIEKIMSFHDSQNAIALFCGTQITKNTFIEHKKVLASLLNDFSALETILDKGIDLCNKTCKADKDYEKVLNELNTIDNSIRMSSAKNIIALVFPSPEQLQRIMDEQFPQKPPPPPKGTYAMAAKYNILKTELLYNLIKKSIKLHIHYLRKNQ